MGATIKDIARHCHVSTSTVSKYINGGKVREKNKIAIDEAIQLYNFKTNAIARGLKTKRSSLVGIVVPTLDSAFFGNIVSGIEALLYKNGFSSIISTFIPGDPVSENRKIEFVLERSVDALVLVPICTKRLDLEGITIPIILIDRVIDDFACDSVTPNNIEIVEKATSKIIEAGHKRIALVNGFDNITPFRDRLKGYYSAFDKHNLPIIKEYISLGEASVSEAYKMMNRLLELRVPPTAVIGANSSLSLGVLLSIKEHGLLIPEDISFIGFDCYDLAIVYRPLLTTIEQDIQQICENVVGLLLRRLQKSDSSPKESIVLKATLIEGNSVAQING